MSTAKNGAKGGSPKPPAPAPPGELTPDQKEQNLREVIADELQQVARRRHALGLEDTVAAPAADERLYEQAGKQDLVGLAFSGGGIRSATFNLGVLQGLAGLTRSGLLKYLDYLSTVSGGGYIGGWLTAWIHRHREGLEGVVRELKNETRASKLEPEPEPLAHLRDYSNFVMPRTGMLSADTWTFVVIYIRNLLLNWVVLIPLLASVLMVPKKIV